MTPSLLNRTMSHYTRFFFLKAYLKHKRLLFQSIRTICWYCLFYKMYSLKIFLSHIAALPRLRMNHQWKLLKITSSAPQTLSKYQKCGCWQKPRVSSNSINHCYKLSGTSPEVKMIFFRNLQNHSLKKFWETSSRSKHFK